MNKILRRVLIAVCLSALSAAFGPKAHSQEIAVKTNLLMWGALTPNLGCEIVTGEHTSIELSAFGHKNPYGLTSEIHAVQPEFRYWFNGRPMIREFIGIGALAAHYSMTVGQKRLVHNQMEHLKRRYENGTAVGLGITGGYAFALGKRITLELSGSFGLLGYNHKDSTDSHSAVDIWGYKLFPVDLGLSFTYIIK